MKLTSLDKTHDERVAKTPAGMAFWAGTGPKNTVCRTCIYYSFEGYHSDRGNKGGTLKNGACKEYIRLMNGKSYKFPSETPSCKFYEADLQPRSRINPRK